MRSFSPFFESAAKLINKMTNNNKDIYEHVIQSDVFKSLPSPFRNL